MKTRFVSTTTENRIVFAQRRKGTLAFIPSDFPALLSNVAFTFTLPITGAQGKVKFSIVSGTLLTGLTFNTKTGVISGTPTLPQLRVVRFEVEDVISSDQITYTIDSSANFTTDNFEFGSGWPDVIPDNLINPAVDFTTGGFVETDNFEDSDGWPPAPSNPGAML